MFILSHWVILWLVDLGNGECGILNQAGEVLPVGKRRGSRTSRDELLTRQKRGSSGSERKRVETR